MHNNVNKARRAVLEISGRDKYPPVHWNLVRREKAAMTRPSVDMVVGEGTSSSFEGKKHYMTMPLILPDQPYPH